MIRPKQTNIFIAHTPLQNYIAERIIQQFFQAKNFENSLYTSVHNDNHDYFKELVVIEKKAGIKKVVQLFKIKHKINSILKKGNCQVFIPHTAALLDNYYFYSFPLHKYNTKINLYYEGILYFYKYEAPFTRKTYLTRKLIGFLNGYNYQMELKILPVDDFRVHSIYTILKKFTLGPREKIREISLLKEKYKPQTNSVLIMGGKPSLLTNEEVIVLYDEMICSIQKELGVQTVYFKGHHADKSKNFEIANRNRVEVIDITQHKPIEEIIDQYSPAAILSYPSSGLINLKAMYGDLIEIKCYYNKIKKEDVKKLSPIFEHMEININLV